MYQKSEPETIRHMFATIAPHYDLANALFSFGIHHRWNRKLIESVGSSKQLLDLCAGTGEIAFGFLQKNQNSRAILLDFCPEMLSIAESKGQTYRERFQILQADAQVIPLPDASVDAITIAYGIRNVQTPLYCFREAYRLLRPEGLFCILELTRPSNAIARWGHQWYTNSLLPLLGKLSAKNLAAYRYLAGSVQTFSSPETLMEQLASVGFKKIEKKSLTFGTATLIKACKIY